MRARPAAIRGARRVRSALEPGPDPALGRAQGHPQEGGDLLMGQVVEERQAQRLPLGRRQRVHGRLHDGATVRAPGRLGRPGARVGKGGRGPFIGGRRHPRPSAATPQLVEDAQVGDPQDPERGKGRAPGRAGRVRQTARKTSWTVSSAVARSSVWEARAKTRGAYRAWSGPSASGLPQES